MNEFAFANAFSAQHDNPSRDYFEDCAAGIGAASVSTSLDFMEYTLLVSIFFSF
jgi:hypothetical protein